MKQITASDIQKLREETGEGLMACKKILVDRHHTEERSEMITKVRELSFTDRKKQNVLSRRY